MTFYVFWSCCTRFLEHCSRLYGWNLTHSSAL